MYVYIYLFIARERAREREREIHVCSLVVTWQAHSREECLAERFVKSFAGPSLCSEVEGEAEVTVSAFLQGQSTQFYNLVYKSTGRSRHQIPGDSCHDQKLLRTMV